MLCRAGSVTLHELAFFEKCAVLVPYPEARGHQLENALVLADKNGAFLMEEKEFSYHRLLEMMETIGERPEVARAMGGKCAQILKLDGADRLADEALRILERRIR